MSQNNPPEYSQEKMEEAKKLAGKYANREQICPCEYCKQHSDNYKIILRALEAAEARIKELDEHLAACKRANSALIISYGEPNDK